MREFWESSAAALEVARHVGDPEALAFAFGAFLTVGAPPELGRDRLGAASEFDSLPRANLRPLQRATILQCLYYGFLSVGERDKSEAAALELDEYACRIGDPFVQTFQMNVEAWRLACKGEFESAVNTAQSFADTAAGGEPFGQAMVGVTAGLTLVRLGRYDEALVYRQAWAAFLASEGAAAYIPAAAGLLDEARIETQRLISERAVRAEDDWTALSTLVYLLDASVLTRDMDVARMLYQRLSGFADLYSPETSLRFPGSSALPRCCSTTPRQRGRIS